MDGQPTSRFRTARHASHCRSAIRCYLGFRHHAATAPSPASPALPEPETAVEDVKALLREAKSLGARYYQATGKALGVSGEVAELEAAEKLGLTLLPARHPGYDALRTINGKPWRIQIKGRAVEPAKRYKGRCPSIKCGDLFDSVALVLLDRTTLEAIEIWEAPERAVVSRLQAPGSKARNERNSMGISQFRSIASKVWPI